MVSDGLKCMKLLVVVVATREGQQGKDDLKQWENEQIGAVWR
jgi:hypothetical protein